jgi:hypothetical protein
MLRDGCQRAGEQGFEVVRGFVTALGPAGFVAGSDLVVNQQLIDDGKRHGEKGIMVRNAVFADARGQRDLPRWPR